MGPLLRWIARVAAYAWASPNTLVGVLLGLLSLQRPRRAGGVLVFDRTPRGFLRAFALTGYRAITLGHVVLCTRRLEGRLLAHELGHVRQYEVLGPLFLPVYLLLFGLRGYRRHPLERAADRAARRAGRPGAPA